ncbi:MAG: FAD-binding oxidoreductase [Cardiobacteriaceae bacterium]|nr:FAD-binding oxidoreductase [Cardiobacteriaceae bacterium]
MSANLIHEFFRALKKEKFSGEYSNQDAQLTVYSTDNSIYQRRPQAVVFPRNTADICTVMRVLSWEKFRALHLTARGGGTGTNGQSLTDGIILDLSRFMNQILEIDVRNRRARVQCGVVKDQLNAALKPHGLFFAPELSTSNRATIGGMINTDASGQGSLRYGKTHDHILGLEAVLLGGEIFSARSTALVERGKYQEEMPEKVKKICDGLHQIAAENAELIAASFPKLTRTLTGYDLPNLIKNNQFNPCAVLCGAEGTLAVIAEAELNLLPIPKYRALVNIGYTNFQNALEDARTLLAQNPLSIETVDSKVLGLAQGDFVWESVKDFFPAAASGKNPAGINIVEFTAPSYEELKELVNRAVNFVRGDRSIRRLTLTIAKTEAEINAVYAMRKRSVGLLGNIAGEKRPQPFVEDTAVPPENLAAYIREFRALLDKNNLDYGMFGHVDAGVLHVRPLIDPKAENSRELFKKISDEVVALTYKYGGVLWGEHGKGLRSEYAPKFFGNCWRLVQRVKYLFDPENRLNPGKIATPSDEFALTKVDEVALRGDFDRQIPAEIWQQGGNAMHCNGNGSCFNYSLTDAMCPSWKVTRDRVHSPKGRAMLFKEWRFRQAQNRLSEEFEREVYAAMRGCLACKSCAGQCPVKVDVPELRAIFLEEYHRKYFRSMRDYLIGNLEYALPLLAKIAPFYNYLLGKKIVQMLLKKTVKLERIPLFSEQAQAKLSDYGAELLPKHCDFAALSREYSPHNAVLVVQDAFTRYFDSDVFRDFLLLFQRLGVKVFVLPYFPNGKPLQIHGFNKRFERLKDKNRHSLIEAALSGIPLVGLDPAMTMVFRQEYRKNSSFNLPILLPQEWLNGYLTVKGKDIYIRKKITKKKYFLAAHCTEKTQIPSAGKDWQKVFEFFGLKLQIAPLGCCGMAGTYGHESENQETSKRLFELSWREKIDNPEIELLATGYSCRCQVKSCADKKILHPVQVLLESFS